MSDKTKTTECRLLIDPPASGAWNMAVDEVLLEWSAAEGGCCWRFYRWEKPTLSLGYFQSLDDRRHQAASRHCPGVRRSRGGGAILHDAELTYSFVVPGIHPLASRRSLMYQAVHNTLLEVLSALGMQGSLCDQSDRRNTEQQPFLCFKRRSPGDVLVGDIKMAGSAQRRLRSAVLQHGSLLLKRSSAAPELDGLDNVAQAPVRSDQIVQLWLEKLARRLALTWHTCPLSRQEQLRAAELVRTKYGCPGWTESRRR